jgi:hypothetical protein
VTERACRSCGELFAKAGPTDANTLCEACREFPQVVEHRGMTLVFTDQAMQLEHELRFAEGVRRGTSGYYAWVAECLGVDSVPRRGR